MKRFIKFDDRNYMEILSLSFLILSLGLSIYTFMKVDIIIKVIEISLIIHFIITSLINPKIGITFNYKKKTISSFVPIFSDCYKLEMNQISQIYLIEIQKKRKKRFYGIYSRIEAMTGSIYEPDYVFRNGKIFNIKIIMKSGKEYIIFYGFLYKARSKNRVQKQVDKINYYIKEFKDYRLKNNLIRIDKN